ncbi:MAG: DinB family protein [Thermoanaerobaculia bacterium]
MLRLEAEAETYLEAIPAAEFAAAQGEKWSPADQVRHVTQSTSPLVPALGLPKFLLALRFGRKAGESRSFVTMRDFYRQTLRDTGATAGRFTPSSRPQPADLAAWQSEVLGAWRAAVAGIAARIPRWSESQLDRYLLPHPVLGKLTVREMLFFTVYHYAHHLDQVASRRAS